MLALIINTFDHERFLRNLSRYLSYQPFGGRSAYDPGRIIVRHEISAVVAVVLAGPELSPAIKDELSEMQEDEAVSVIAGPIRELEFRLV